MSPTDAVCLQPHRILCSKMLVLNRSRRIVRHWPRRNWTGSSGPRFRPRKFETCPEWGAQPQSNPCMSGNVPMSGDTVKLTPERISWSGCPNPRGSSVIVVAVHGARPNIEYGDFQMKYILMDYVHEAGWPTLTNAEQEHWLGAYIAYTEAMTKAGVLKASTGLQPTSSATTVRVANGKTQVLDGPYADSKEQLGGYFVDRNGDMRWAHNQDAEWNAFVAENARGGGELVFGRITYEMMASFW